MLEYVLIPGVNDLDEHARELANWIQGDADAPLRCCVNVIPYNPRQDSPWPAPDEETVERFITTLASTGVYVKRRRTKGRDQMAACGQLGNLEYRRKKAQA
jgi:23S rRNA (adenine2503-C2)-methyltransferase